MFPSSPRPFLVASRFRGPAQSGNGGYTAGRLASFIDTPGQPVTVTLRRPPPLDTELQVGPSSEDAGIELWNGEQLVASAAPGAFQADPVESVDFETATSARSSYRGAVDHPFPHCFVCGPARVPGDGMRLAPGLIDEGRTACSWLPDPSLTTAEDRSLVGVEFGWAALDCPGGWASDLEARPMVLGRMTASVTAALRAGRAHVVVGRLLREEGRKTFTATSLYDDDGRLVGRAEHTWIVVDPTTFRSG
jgi:hypothetical protein